MRGPLVGRVEDFDVKFHNGMTWKGTVYGTAHRPEGRRIVVRSTLGIVMFDSSDQYDLANAKHALTVWLSQIETLVRPAPTAGAA